MVLLTAEVRTVAAPPDDDGFVTDVFIAVVVVSGGFTGPVMYRVAVLLFY